MPLYYCVQARANDMINDTMTIKTCDMHTTRAGKIQTVPFFSCHPRWRQDAFTPCPQRAPRHWESFTLPPCIWYLQILPIPMTLAPQGLVNPGSAAPQPYRVPSDILSPLEDTAMHMNIIADTCEIVPLVQPGIEQSVQILLVEI